MMVSLYLRRPGSPVGQSKEHLINNSTRRRRVLLAFEGRLMCVSSLGFQEDFADVCTGFEEVVGRFCL